MSANNRLMYKVISWREPGTFPYVPSVIVVQHKEGDPQWLNIAAGVVDALRHGGLFALAEPIRNPDPTKSHLGSPIRINLGKH